MKRQNKFGSYVTQAVVFPPKDDCQLAVIINY